MKTNRLLIYGFTLLGILTGCNTSRNLLTEVKILPNYPSASGIEYTNQKIYIIGDDANNLLILDSSLNNIDSASFYSFAEKRIPKKVKPDLEAITNTQDGKLLLIGSGSLATTRNIGWLFDPLNKQKDSIRLDTFYQQLSLNGIKELNIEGLASCPGGYILSNRGSKGYPKNHLIFTKGNFWIKQSQSQINIMDASSHTDSSLFSGISGLAYSAKADALIMTVSTEDTRNSMDDGAIGKSYLWIIKNISAKLNRQVVNTDVILELDAMDTRFKGQKIESVCISKETARKYYLLLVADNDNGSSTLFRLTVSKE